MAVDFSKNYFRRTPFEPVKWQPCWGELPEWEAKLRRKFIGIENPQPKQED